MGHVGPNVMAFLAFGLTPRGLEGLGGDLDADCLASQDIQVPLRMRVGTPLDPTITISPP